MRNTRRGHVFLVPPLKKCIRCNHDLTVHKASELRMLTEQGQVNATELSYQCKHRQCPSRILYHYDYRTDADQGKVHYAGDVRSEQYQIVHSGFLGKDVSVPCYVRVSRQLWMSWDLLEHVSALLSHGDTSYSQVSKILHKTVLLRNLDTTDIDYWLQHLENPSLLVVHHHWFQLLRVCTDTFSDTFEIHMCNLISISCYSKMRNSFTRTGNARLKSS